MLPVEVSAHSSTNMGDRDAWTVETKSLEGFRDDVMKELYEDHFPGFRYSFKASAVKGFGDKMVDAGGSRTLKNRVNRGDTPTGAITRQDHRWRLWSGLDSVR
jgi:hypothetical protein